MKKTFRFDYNDRMHAPFLILILAFVFFLVLSIMDRSIEKILLCIFCISLFWGFWLYGYGYGIQFDYHRRRIRVRRSSSQIIIKFDEIKRIYYYEKNVKKGSKLKNFFEYVFRKYSYDSAKYTFNEGKVFVIVINYQSGYLQEIEFPWMYKEKSRAKAEKVESQLKAMIDEFNATLFLINKQKLTKQR